MKIGRIDVITMGCSKNLVDSERLMKQLNAKGYHAVHNSDNVCGEIVVVNTCGFIGDAKEESIEMIINLAEGKKNNRIGKLIVMGCLSERYLKELRDELPEVDEWYGKFDWTKLIESLPVINNDAEPKPWERQLTTPSYSAYLKISEGCDRFCAYCAIPLITGRHKSRPMEEIIAETRQLVDAGVKEFNVIAQDLSAYGKDLYGEYKLAELIEKLSEIKGVEWIRLHYAYPVDFPWDVLRVMREKENVCNYLDIALQHISDPVLKNMRRHITKKETIELIARIRKEVPGIRIRTTLMTGFPGEGEKEFDELLEFVKDTKFDRMGAFAYSEEEDTWGQKHLDDSIPEDVKNSRLQRLMEIQEGISYDLNQNLINENVKVLVERIEDDNTVVGRTQWDSPEVDQDVYVTIPDNINLNPGDFINAKVDDADTFEVYATFISKI
jgi:ribosomal protein S12 methylthiotransferase